MKAGKAKLIWGAVAAVVVVAGFFIFRAVFDSKPKVSYREYRPEIGDIRQMVSTTATIKPQNRLEIKSPVSGRIDQILVREGEFVKKGQVLALVSSTERAALLDAATQKGQSEVDYWNRVYNQTALISPIDGQVIVSNLNPGQTITTSDAVLVLSDRLIVQADVDETDIGNVKVGQKARISLDAYPDIRVEGVVDHIYYESTLVNNVNIYHVDILPLTVPEVFRSGMSANIDIIVKEKENVLTLPLAAVRSQNGRSVVLMRAAAPDSVRRVPVRLGLQDDSNVEIESGLSASDVVVVQSKAFVLPKDDGGSNPFLPSPPRDKQKRKE
ncbi:HlyD family efflux transporter periplasmic adaptor subunit [Chlorobaculum sp. 24CR]|uniref:efflux RND transporter periplasmic adaptor subunit n=1 Tax=Chlorobaculum sp. 24CR TaxID=2508878 RepID=UPI00100B39EC|nr:efflux RND transporter periplasmic adaptor subunit [Chlorobaculum sp. 24CR]RXK82750.1 HlyD family efflux transporter periplasmic adaptor subunit [Chlorobaculum sp. 24CR]